MNEKKENMVGVLVISIHLCSHLIHVPRAKTVVFIEENCKKRISISHILEGN